MLKLLAASAALALALAGAAHADVAVFNTGEGSAAGDGQTDSHYAILSSDIPGVSPGAALTYYNGAYAAEDADSRWVSYSGSPFGGVGTTTFRTTFDLTGYDIATALLAGAWGVDNEGSILLNGVSIANLAGTTVDNFNHLHAFGASTGFLAGMNTLDFVVHDTGSPMAFRVDDISVSAATIGGSVPEPATWAMMIAGFGMAGVALRRRRTACA